MPGVIVDIGTGDGSFVYELAKRYPDKLIIGIEPNQSGLVEVSRKANKKPKKGGVKNALFVLANVSNLPDELNGVANQVFINFPWGSLLKGLALGDKETWSNISKICQNSALIDILLGYDKNLETKSKTQGLPTLNLDYLKNVLAPKLERFGFEFIRIQAVNAKVLKFYPSKWAKKLSFANIRDYYHIRLLFAK